LISARTKEVEMDEKIEGVTGFSLERTYDDRVRLLLSLSVTKGPTILIIEPKYAMRIWRCFTGETEREDIKCQLPMFGIDQDLVVRYVDELQGWELVTCSCFMNKAIVNADQALAIAWAIKSVITSITMESESFKGSHAKSVFVLSARRMLNGDCAENGVDQIGGTEMVFANERDARDNVREFMRPLVNESFGEAYWEERNVDDVLDDIFAAADAIYNPEKPTVWLCEGQKQSFEVELSERAVR
jgi:hypothetical protein